ncbi:hypothetical protein ACFVGI_000871 [Serratia marcescens]|nr:hypothetical protein [Serratia marcescens]
MFVMKSDRLSNNQYLPILSISEQEIEILKLTPSAWIESTNGIEMSGENVTLIRDKTGKTSWKPVGANAPRIVLSNKVPVLNFGPGRGVSNSGAIRAENGYESFPQNGEYTLFILYRAPVPNQGGYNGTGGNLCGNNTAAPDWLRVRLGSDSYLSDAAWINHGGTAVSDPTNYPINTAIAGFRDNLWHTAVIEVSSAYHRWEHDGTLRQLSSQAAKPFLTPESRMLIIGGAGNPLSHGWQGDIAAVLLIPKVVSDTDKAMIYQRLNAMKARLTST